MFWYHWTMQLKTFWFLIFQCFHLWAEWGLGEGGGVRGYVVHCLRGQCRLLHLCPSNWKSFKLLNTYNYIHTQGMFENHTAPSLTRLRSRQAVSWGWWKWEISGQDQGSNPHFSPFQSYVQSTVAYIMECNIFSFWGGGGELAQLVRARGLWPWGQGYESQSWL